MILIPPNFTVVHKPTGTEFENATNQTLRIKSITLNGEVVHDTSLPVVTPPERQFLPKGRLSKTVKFVHGPSGKIIGAELFEVPKA